MTLKVAWTVRIRRPAVAAEQADCSRLCVSVALCQLGFIKAFAAVAAAAADDDDAFESYAVLATNLSTSYPMSQVSERLNVATASNRQVVKLNADNTELSVKSKCAVTTFTAISKDSTKRYGLLQTSGASSVPSLQCLMPSQNWFFLMHCAHPGHFLSSGGHTVLFLSVECRVNISK